MKKLTARQVEVMDALIRLGDRKLVARELQIERNTVDGILRNAVARMGVRNRLQAVLKYDRERRSVITSTPGVATGQSTRWCPECRSSGVVGIEQDVCPTCDGTGKVAASGVTPRHPRCGYPYCGCVGECFVASQPGAAAGVLEPKQTDGGTR